MTSAGLPVLWLYGPSGVGKSTVGWELFRELYRAGRSAGFVDIDQLGMCYPPPVPGTWLPEPASDPGRHRLEARNLDAVAANFRAAGADCLVVPGVVDAVRGADPALLPHARLTACRLRCTPDELLRRLAARGRPGEDTGEILADARALERNHPSGPVVDTTGLAVAAVLRLIRDQTDGWPGTTGPDRAGPQLIQDQTDDRPDTTGSDGAERQLIQDQTNGRPDTTGPDSAGPRLIRDRTGGTTGATGRSGAGRPLVRDPAGGSLGATGRDDPGPFGAPQPAGGEILWLCGAPAVGKSTVGWQVYQQVQGAGSSAGFADLDQLGWHRPGPTADPGNHRLKAANLAAVWHNFRGAGATRLIVVGPVERAADLRAYRAALPGAAVTVCRLHAGRDQLAERVRRRGRGEGPPIPGDELTGQPAAVLDRVADAAAGTAAALDRAALGDLRVATDARTVSDIAREILRRTGW